MHEELLRTPARYSICGQHKTLRVLSGPIHLHETETIVSGSRGPWRSMRYFLFSQWADVVIGAGECPVKPGARPLTWE